MMRRAAGVGLGLGLVMAVACSGGPQAPSPLNTQASPPSPAAPPAGPPMTSIVGTYSASLLLPACSGLPEADRRRSYTARIHQDDASGVHVVTLSDATFLDSPPSRFHPVPLTPNQFLASHGQDQASFSMFADWESSYGGHIIERISNGQWMSVEGRLEGQVGRDTIAAVGTGEVVYCQSPVVTDSYYCEDAQWMRCGTPLTLTLVRR